MFKFNVHVHAEKSFETPNISLLLLSRSFLYTTSSRFPAGENFRGSHRQQRQQQQQQQR
jgi:hypothetical protein